MDDAERMFRRPGVLGGSGGGMSSDPELPVLRWRLVLVDLEKAELIYFWRMKRSMAESASSASMGTGGFWPTGLYTLLDAALPTLRMFYKKRISPQGDGREAKPRGKRGCGRTSTCSLDQLSMLKDLTLDTCVPNLRWIAAHRMQRKTPSCVSGRRAG